MKTVLVTGCTRDYLPLLREFMQSVTDAGGRDHVDIAVFDLDFEREERAWLETQCDTVVYPEAPIEVPPDWRRDRRYLSSIIRPFLPAVFPGYDIYLYSDVDVWVQDWSGFDLFIRAAKSGAFAVVPQIDRSYRDTPASLEFRRRRYAEVFDPQTALALEQLPHVNGGVFALPRNAPHWERWAEWLRHAAHKQATWFGAGQAILTHMTYQEEWPRQLLPAVNNWMCHLARPMWDEESRRYVAPFLPHERINTMHLTAKTKNRSLYIRTIQGRNLVNTSLRYPDYLALCATGVASIHESRGAG